VANALNGLGNIARIERNLAEAEALYQETLAMSQHGGNVRGIARALHNLACVAQDDGDYARAIALNEESLTHRRTLGDHLAVAATQYNQAICYRQAGDSLHASAMFSTLLPQFEACGDWWSVWAVHNELGRIACAQGQYQAAMTHLEASLRGFKELGDGRALVDVLENWALALAGQGNPALAARLLGTVEAAHTAGDRAFTPSEHEAFLADVAATQRLLDADTFAIEWAMGQTLTVEEAIPGVLALHLQA
jgi:tetratricopeptide (TPR) repeat protein